MRKTAKVTYAKADRVIRAVAALIECDDFAELAREGGEPQGVAILDRAADLARAIRDTTR